jgi:phage tail sheath gpL-like
MPSPNMTSGQVVPGIYGYVDYNAQGSSQAPSNRALLWGYVGATAQAPLNRPFLPASQQEADDGCEQGSDLARMYAACMAQPESQGAEVWLMPITAPSGGVASSYTFKVVIPTTIAKPGTIQIWIASRAIAAVGFTTTDTATTIGDAIAAAINAALDLPLGTVVNATGTLTIPYVHKGLVGEDLPVRCNISPAATGVYLSPGKLTFASAAGASGTALVSTGNVSVSTAIAQNDTATQIGGKVAAAINADAYPFTALDGGDGTVTLYFANNRDVRRLAAAMVTVTTTTVNLGSGATDGTGSATSLTYNGTVGTGVPSLSSALTSLGQYDAFRAWASSFADSTTLGTLATAMESQSDGSQTGQKQQILIYGACGPMSVAGALATAATPNLTATPPHYTCAWGPDMPAQGYELAVRLAGARAALWLDTPQKNWNGYQLVSSDKAPLLSPFSRPGTDTLNSALRTYALAPIVKGSVGVEVVKGRTTSLAANKKLWAWSAEAQAAYHEVDLAQRFAERFKGGSIVRLGEPKAPGLFDKQSFIACTIEAMHAWELEGNYDGADALAGGVSATPDKVNPFRMNVDFPESPVMDLDQVCFASHFASPSA